MRTSVIRRWFSRRRIKAALYAVLGAVSFLLVFFLIHLPHGPEHWSADLRTAYLSKRLASQHPRIVLIEITDRTLEQYPYVTPTDRQLLAEVVRAIDTANPKLIGLDLVFDRPTEPFKDEELLDAIREAKAPVVLGTLDEQTLRPDEQRFHAAFIARANRPVGHLYLDEHHSPLVVSDHVVRLLPPAHLGRPSRASFADELARGSGSNLTRKGAYIAWLLLPKDTTETFLTLSAEHILGRGGLETPLPLRDLLRDKIVLIGGNVQDRDRHLTPLSVISDGRYSGLSIHAQILAQLLDDRSMRVVGLPAVLAIMIAAGGCGVWFGRAHRYERYHLLLELGGAATLILIAVIAFVVVNLIFPFISTLLAWLAGITAGRYSTWVRR